MTEYVIAKYKSASYRIRQLKLAKLDERLIVALLLVLLLFTGGDLSRITLETISSAYISVSALVAFTLMLIYAIEKFFKFDIGAYNAVHPRSQVIISSLLGATPGCGGSIVVVTQFVKGQASFGSVIAALCTNMGDAAFLLLAKEPLTWVYVISGTFVIGVATGLLVDKIHGRDFLQSDYKNNAQLNEIKSDENQVKNYRYYLLHNLKKLWFIVLIPGLFLSFMNAVQLDVNNYIKAPIDIELFIGAGGGILTILIWILDKKNHIGFCNTTTDTHLKVLRDTSFISVWVIAAFLCYELTLFYGGFDIKNMFEHHKILLPLMGVVVGLIPGCGPQIIVTMLYLSGAVPMSTLIANVISNDGDALFPAIAIAPKASIIATIYGIVPSLIFGYGYYFLFE